MNLMDGAQTHEKQAHPIEVRRAYERVLAGSAVRSRHVGMPGGDRAHLLEIGSGPPVVLLHGGGGSAAFFAPLLTKLEGVRALVPDRPGQGLSDPIDLPRRSYREAAVAWLDRLLDALALDATALAGHSGGAMWALWYALAHPERVNRLVLIAPPAVPKTNAPLPIRLAATPGVGELLSRLAPPGPKAVLRFAHHVAGEGETLARYPDLVDLFVATFGDPLADRVGRAEERVFLSPFAMLSRSGFRRRARLRPDELSRVATPTLLVWGERDPLGDASVARAAAGLIPRARLEVLPTGHGPWLGEPARTAKVIADFVR
jgi:pimeloyl-ACP methyl ester carboxylesterase